MKKKKIVIGIICILLVLLGGGFFFVSKLLKKNVTQTNVDDWGYSVTWCGISYTGVYSGKMKNGYPTGKGSFQGIAYIDGTEYDAIIYTGKWKDGKFDGDGILKQDSIQMTYEGKFKEGSLNGTIKLYKNEDSIYSKVTYKKDIPKGVSFLYDEEENILDYDYYFMGMSVKSICKTAEEIPYESLLYENELYHNKRIKLSCKVQDIYQKNGYWYVKVTDKDKNVYILRYSFDSKDDATTYMPELEVGQQVEVYGFCSELIQYDSEVNSLPSIDALCISGFENQILQDQRLKKTYGNFTNYPNFYKNSQIKLNGKISGIYDIDEDYIFFYIESENYSEDGKKLYICYMENSDDNIATLSTVSDNIMIHGQLKLTRSVDVSKKGDASNTLEKFPCVAVTEIITK